MKLIFLGIQGGVQSDKSGNVSFLIQDDESTVLFDCSGSPAKEFKNAGIDLLDLSAIVISHAHIDHIYGLPSLIHNLWLMGRKNELNIFSNDDAQTHIKELLNVFDMHNKPKMFPINFIKVGQDSVDIGGLNINFFDVNHSIPTTGMMVSSKGSKITYCADTSPIHEYPDYIIGSNFLIHEASGCSVDEKKLNQSGHSSGHQAGLFGSEVQAGKLFICHLPCDLNLVSKINEETSFSFNKEVVIPDVLEKYEI